jgi:hypothetical protein
MSFPKKNASRLSKQRPAVLVLCSVIAVLAGFVSTWAQVLSTRPKLPRLVITPSSATVTAGKAMSFKITMFDAVGRPAPANSDLSVELTLTTLRSLDAVKKQISETLKNQVGTQAGQSKTLDQRSIGLASGQTLNRLEVLFAKGQSDVTVKALIKQTGQIRLFAESSRFSPGEAVLIVVSPATNSSKYGWSGGPSINDYQGWASANSSPVAQLSSVYSSNLGIELQPLWQTAALREPVSPPVQAGSFALELNGPGIEARIDKGAWIADFYVALKSGTKAEYLPAPEEIKIILKVLNGAAWFDPMTVSVRAGQAISETFFLRSRVGGKTELAATPIQTGSLKIRADRISYPLQPGTRAEYLKLNPIGGPALANNLDPVTIEVRAMQKGADGQEYVVTADEESLSERLVSFRIEGGFGARFEHGNNQVRIPKGQDSGQIKIFSNLPAGALRVSAVSTNGLQNEIHGEPTTVSFQLPAWPFVSAIVGGLVWGVGIRLLRKTRWVPSLFRGGVGGFLFYVIVFFGALLVSYAELTGVPLDIARLPSASWLAAIVIGLVGAEPGAWFLESVGKRSGGKPSVN